MNTIVASTSSRIPSKALSPDDLRRIAPSVFAETARPGVSNRYTFVSTAQVVELLDAEGWSPVRASQQRVRLENREGFQMHELRFARRVDLESEAFAVGDTRPELILQNAHDGTRAYRIDAGLYRLVCRNGLTVADTDFAHASIRHMDVSAEAFARAAQEKGQWTAFREYAADDALMFVPQPVAAKDWLKKQANPAQAVTWQPYAVWSSCDGSLAVTGMETDDVAELAARVGIVLYELSPQSSLEDAFMESTDDAVEFRAIAKEIRS